MKTLILGLATCSLLSGCLVYPNDGYGRGGSDDQHRYEHRHDDRVDHHDREHRDDDPSYGIYRGHQNVDLYPVPDPRESK